MTENDKVQGILDRIDAFKQEIEQAFGELGYGKDAVLEVHNALDQAAQKVAVQNQPAGLDANVELAEKPEDLPAAQGNETPTPAEQAVPEAQTDEAAGVVPAEEEGHTVQVQVETPEHPEPEVQPNETVQPTDPAV